MRSRLFLVTPIDLVTGEGDLRRFSEDLIKSLAAADVASVLLQTEGGSEAAIRDAVVTLCPMVQDADAAFLVEGRADLAGELGCDGVHVPAEAKSLKALRKALGDDLIVGADCGQSRHLGMVAGELGADYVCFDALDSELLSWWAEMMEVPSVAWGGVSLDNAAEIIGSGADFLAVGDAVWTHGAGPVAAVQAFNEIMDRLAPEGDEA
ncbi:thiamine phosphate synthase [Rhodovibrionaceae bacterium A322]